MAKFCNNCGQKLDDDAAFCMECGTKVDDSGIKNNFKSSINKENINASMNKLNDSIDRVSNDFNDSFSDLFDSYNINMMKDEKVIRHSQIHQGCLYAPLIVVGLTFFFMIITFFVLFPFFLLALLWLFIRFIAYTSNDLILTNKRIFGKTGLISTTQMQSPLNKINSVAFNNGIIGKLLGYGTVHVVTASTMYKFRFIRDGQTLYNDIFQQLEQSEKEKLQEQAEAIANAISKNN